MEAPHQLWAVILALLPASPGHRAEVLQPAGLVCQLHLGPWQPCQMQVEDPGLRWHLELGDTIFWFEHDGRGQVRMRQGHQDWQAVDSAWRDDASLCWGPLCAKGDLPLD